MNDKNNKGSVHTESSSTPEDRKIKDITDMIATLM
jgi:hypothetical protein